jgi:tetratricopeptide (TPR) repeat protein
MNNLAYLLIEKDLDIKEGLELVDRAQKLRPNSLSLFHRKGWGLYKQGKYNEALELPEKADSLKPIYNHSLYLHLEAAIKAVAGQKNN